MARPNPSARPDLRQDNDNVRWTHHAAARCCQRGISDILVSIVLRYGDLECEVGDACVSIRLSYRRAADLVPLLGDQARRACEIAIILTANDNIRTVLRPKGGRGRRYTAQ